MIFTNNNFHFADKTLALSTTEEQLDDLLEALPSEQELRLQDAMNLLQQIPVSVRSDENFEQIQFLQTVE